MSLKKTAVALSLLTAIGASGMANAGKSQVTIKLEGAIVPAACDISNSTGSTAIPLGKLSFDRLNATTATVLPTRSTTLNIICPSATAVGFQPKDVAEKAGQVTYEGMMNSPFAFSLGQTSEGNVIGGYVVSLDKEASRVDSKLVNRFLSSKGATNSGWDTVENSDTLVAKGDTIYSWATELLKSTPDTGKIHSIVLKFTPFISPTSSLKTSEKIDIKGEATYDLVYL